MEKVINEFSIGLFLWQLVIIGFASLFVFIIYKVLKKYVFNK